MITTTERVNELYRQSEEGLHMAEVACLKLRHLIEAGRTDRRHLVREIYIIQEEEMAKVMKERSSSSTG